MSIKKRGEMEEISALHVTEPLSTLHEDAAPCIRAGNPYTNYKGVHVLNTS